MRSAIPKRSTAISSILDPDRFGALMATNPAATTVDRILRHAHLCQTSSESGLYYSSRALSSGERDTR